MLVKQYQIYKLFETYGDTGCDHAMISFPTGPEGGDYEIVDAWPCDKDGNVADGYVVGVPMYMDCFGELIRDSDDY